MPDADGKPEPPQIDPAKLEQLLEIELMQKRAAWQQAKAKRGSLRALSFMFLFFVIAGAAVAFFYVFSSGTLTERQQLGSEGSPTPAATPE
jgi:flagellar basal body-associated protein FliL